MVMNASCSLLLIFFSCDALPLLQAGSADNVPRVTRPVYFIFEAQMAKVFVRLSRFLMAHVQWPKGKKHSN